MHVLCCKANASGCVSDKLFVSLISKWAEYVLFASLLLVVCVIFSIMAYFYQYIDPAEIEAQFKKKEENELKKDYVEMAKRDSVKSGHKDNLTQTRM